MCRVGNDFKSPSFAAKVICVPGVQKTKYNRESLKNNLRVRMRIFLYGLERMFSFHHFRLKVG